MQFGSCDTVHGVNDSAKAKGQANVLTGGQAYLGTLGQAKTGLAKTRVAMTQRPKEPNTCQKAPTLLF